MLKMNALFERKSRPRDAPASASNFTRYVIGKSPDAIQSAPALTSRPRRPGRPYLNQMPLQYLINYNMKNGWYLSVSPFLTTSWRASSGSVWTVPFGGGVGRIMKLGFQHRFYFAGSTLMSAFRRCRAR